MEIKKMKVGAIRLSTNNPRLIKDEKFQKLVKSITDFPEMLNIRPIVVNDEMEIIGGNMRYSAAIECGLQDIPVMVAKGLTIEQQNEFTIKDNVSAGEWNWAELITNWSANDLSEWGFDNHAFATAESVFEDFNNKDEEPYEPEQVKYSESPTITDDGYVRFEMVLLDTDKKILTSKINAVKNEFKVSNAEAFMYIINKFGTL